MTKLDVVRQKLDNKLFNNGAVLKSQLTHYTYNEGADSFGGYSSDDPTYTDATTYACVPYNNMPSRFNIQPFGDFQEGDMYVAVRYDTPLAIKDKVNFNSNDYFVQEIKEVPLNDGIAVKIAQVRVQH